MVDNQRSSENPLLKHNGTVSTQFTFNQGTGTHWAGILSKKYQDITDHHYAFDIIAMTTLRKGTKALIDWQEVQLSIPGEYDYFNGYCTADRYKYHLSIMLKFHQFNIDKPVFYRLDDVADVHEINLIRKKMLQKQAIEKALKNLSKDQIEACYVNLENYMFNRPLINEDPNESMRERILSLSSHYTVYRAVSIKTPEAPVLDTVVLEPAVHSLAFLEACYFVDSDTLFAGSSLSLLALEEDSSLSCPFYFTNRASEGEDDMKDKETTDIKKKEHFRRSSLTAIIYVQVPCEPAFIEESVETFYQATSQLDSTPSTSKYLITDRPLVEHRQETTPTRASHLLRRIYIGSKFTSKKRQTLFGKLNLKTTEVTDSLSLHQKPLCAQVSKSRSRIFESRNSGISSIDQQMPSFGTVKLKLKERILDSPGLSPTHSKSKMSSFIIKISNKTPRTQKLTQNWMDIKRSVLPNSFVVRKGELCSPTAYMVRKSRVIFGPQRLSNVQCMEDGQQTKNSRLTTSNQKLHNSKAEDSQVKIKNGSSKEELLTTKSMLPLGLDLKKSILTKILKDKADIFSMYQTSTKADVVRLPQTKFGQSSGSLRFKSAVRAPTKDRHPLS